MNIRIRLNPDAPIGKLKTLLCAVLGHDMNVVHDATGKGPDTVYRECYRCELQIDSWGNETTKAERLARKKAA